MPRKFKPGERVKDKGKISAPKMQVINMFQKKIPYSVRLIMTFIWNVFGIKVVNENQKYSTKIDELKTEYKNGGNFRKYSRIR